MSSSFIGEDDHILILNWDDSKMEKCDPCAHVCNFQYSEPWDKCNHI